MKKNDWILLVSVALYSYLFYEQAAGINFFLFNIFILASSVIKNPDAYKNKNWIITAAGSFISSACIMMYSSPLAIVTNILSLGIFSVMNFSPATSVFVSLFLSLCSAGSSIVFMFLDMFKRRRNNPEKENKKPFYVKVIIFMIVMVITILFFVMYQSSNPLFKDFTKNINFDFISAAWIFFTLGGLILLYGFYYNRHIGWLTSNEAFISNNLNKEEVTSEGFFNKLFREDTELLTGIILFSVLNFMLLVLNMLDLNYLWFDGTLPEGIQHKEFVHDGVGTLILSVLFAISILLYFFRGRLNYCEKSKTIKMLAYSWIIQNAFMIFSTAYRMNMYVCESGISYKKIGVYVYLGLTLLGLITTYIKVAKNKTNWYLFRLNPQAYYAIMVLSCTINWDVFITKFNINKALTENKKLEKYYLADLSFKNIPELLKLSDTIKSSDDYDARDYYYSSRGTYFYNFKSALDKKTFDFLEAYYKNSDWQSYCSEKNRVYNEILDLNNQKVIKSISLNNNYYLSSIAPLRELTNTEILELDNNFIRRLEEFASFTQLKKLSLGSNQIDSLQKFPVLINLQDLNLSGNTLSGIQFLKNAPNLKILNLQNTSVNEISLLPGLKGLKALNLSGNSINDFLDLNKFPLLADLEINNTFRGKLDTFPQLAKLRLLDIGSNEITASNAFGILTQLKGAVELKKLVLSTNTLTNVYSLIDIATSQALFPHVEVLDISNNKLYTVAGIGVHTQLKEIYLASNEIKDIEPLLKLRNLKTLSIEYNPIVKLEGIEQLSELEYLNISSCGIRTGFVSLSQLKKLNSLNVSGNHISNLNPFCTLSNLRYLNLTENKIKSLKGIEQLQNLEELYMTGNLVTDVTPLMALKKLKTLYLNKISEEDLKKLKNALPDCKIDDSTYPSGTTAVVTD